MMMSSGTRLNTNGELPAAGGMRPASGEPRLWSAGVAGEDEVARVEAVVRAVLRSLLGAGPGPGPRLEAGPVVPGEPGAGVSCFAGPVLGDRQVGALAAGTVEVRIEPGTVVTPLGRERLKQRGIRARIVSRAELARVGAVGEWGVAFEAGGELLRRTLLGGPDAWLDLGDDGGPAAAWIGERPGRAGVIVTDTAALACYRACQVAGVRAAVAGDSESLRLSLETLRLNCLVVERPAVSIHGIRHLCATFRRLGSVGDRSS